MFDPAKPVTTRDGRPVRILCTDARGRFPIVGLISQTAGEYAQHWRADGVVGDSDNNHLAHMIAFGSYRHMDLVNSDA